MDKHEKAFYSLTANEAAQRIREGSLTASALVVAYLEQIGRLDPTLGAWETVDREGALAAARRADEEQGATGLRGPLHGIPIGVKDIFNTAGLPTRRGSPIYRDFIPDEDAACVARLKAAGAIILGKTVTTEFATTDPTSTRNPWDPECTPGGSSTGSAVAVATQMCPAALGSQTAGSTLRPAAYNGIVGLKPTYGRISRVGVFPVAWTLDTVGILARTVEDAALLLQVMAGHDPKDPLSSHEPVPNYQVEMLQQRERAPRIGVAWGLFWDLAITEVREHTSSVLADLERAGATVQEVALPHDFATALDAQAAIMATEAAAAHRDTYAARPNDYGPRIRDLLEAGARTSGMEYVQAQRYRRRLRREVEAILDQWDVLLTPATPGPAPRDLTTTGDRTFQSPLTLAGLPTIALPTGLNQAGLPLGVQLVGKAFGEGTLLGAARWCERVLGVTLTPPLGA